jgi:hypothetical protein
MPTVALKVPTGQGVQLPGAVADEPVSCCPAGQGVIAVHCVAYVPRIALNVPLGQFVHVPVSVLE